MLTIRAKVKFLFVAMPIVHTKTIAAQQSRLLNKQTEIYKSLS